MTMDDGRWTMDDKTSRTRQVLPTDGPIGHRK